MNIFNIFTLFGGLALFLYGMDLMGKGLESASGGKLEKILETLTSNIIRAVLLGVGVTAVIQSSSATTVMVVGFVNSGIMPLSRAIGVIMGANIGTTVTSWILSLSGLQGDNFFVQLVKPSSFSPILAVIGIILIMFSKREKHHNIGNIMIGFAVLMFGMETMSGAVEPLADMPAFTNILLMFSNPILGVLAGTVLTAIIQSSSASVGILQALCLTGSVTFGTAIPIIMGQNIGTCITAILSAIGANRNAKRAASIHLMFNIIGTILFLTIFYTINFFVPFEFLADSATPVGIAIIHSAFNISATLVLLPFSKMFEKLAYLVIGETEEERKQTSRTLDILDQRFLEIPGYALEQGKMAVQAMFRETRSAYLLASALTDQYEETTVAKIRHSEEKVDGYEDQICNYLLELSKEKLNGKESQTVSVLLHTVTDIETISDNVCSIAISCKALAEKENNFSHGAIAELNGQNETILKLMDATMAMFDGTSAGQVQTIYQEVEDWLLRMKEGNIARMRDGKCQIESGLIWTDLINYYERIAVRCRRISGYLDQMGEQELEIHDHVLKEAIPE